VARIHEKQERGASERASEREREREREREYEPTCMSRGSGIASVCVIYPRSLTLCGYAKRDEAILIEILGPFKLLHPLCT